VGPRHRREAEAGSREVHRGGSAQGMVQQMIEEGPAFTPGSGSGNPKTDPPSISPPLAARWRADRGTPATHRSEPVLKDGPNTASRRRPLKRPHREPTE
jgi:hypothetical protein